MKKLIAAFTLTLLGTAVFAADNCLPTELQQADKSKIFQMKPSRGKFAVEDKDAEAAYAISKSYPQGHAFGEFLSVAYLMPKHTPKWGKGPKIQYSSLPAGQYSWVKWGTNAVVQGTGVVLNNDWGKALDFRNVDAACTQKGKGYTLFLRLKLQGPAFDPTSSLKENTISLDKMVFVEEP